MWREFALRTSSPADGMAGRPNTGGATPAQVRPTPRAPTAKEFADDESIKDKELLRKWFIAKHAPEGDTAFAALTLRLHHRVTAAVKPILGEAQASEVAQDTFIKLIKNADAMLRNPRQDLFCWLRTVAVRDACGIARKKDHKLTRTESALTSRDGDSPLDAVPTRCANDEYDMLLDTLEAHIADLPDDLHECVALLMTGMKQTDIAAVLGLSDSTVSHRIDRAVQFLREKMSHELKTEGRT